MGEAQDSIKVREGAAVWRELDGETVVLDLEHSTYLGLNATGTLLWPAMVDGASTERLVDLIVDRFGVGRQQASADVAAFVAECRRRRLIED